MQRLMNGIFDNLRGKGVEVYMDDIVVHGKTEREHDKLLMEVMRRLEKNKIKINFNKVQLRQNEVFLFGVKINGIMQTASEIKKNEALEFPQPSNVKELRKFLNLTGWFRTYIKGYAIVTRSLQMH